jgi:hypothetical protein
VTDIHASAAISLQAKIVENFLCILTCINGGLVLFIEVCDDLAATPTSYWNKHL